MTPTDTQIAQLQQRYAQSQQLIDLLALQKLKSDKEAAARDMQLKMAQQQGAAGLPTIKDRLENEVMGMTKQEVAQQVTDVAQQRQQQQQQAMQQVAESGIAQNPAPNMQGFAGGGIVAFQSGGDTSSVLGRTFAPIIAPIKDAFSSLFGPGGVDVSAIESMSKEVEGLRRRKIELGGRLGTRQQSQQEADEYQRVSDKLAELELKLADMRSGGRKPDPEPTQGDKAMPFVEDKATRQALTKQNMQQLGIGKPSAAPPTPTQTPPPPADTTPQPQAQSGVQSLLAGLPKEFQSLPTDVAGTASTLMNQDPRVAQQEEERRIQAKLELTPQQRAIYESGVAERQRMMAELQNPERLRDEALRRGLMAASGGGTFASVGTGIMNTETQQRTAQQKAFEEMQKAREGLVGIDRQAVVDAINAGKGIGAQVSKERTDGLTQGRSLFGDLATLESQERDRLTRERIADKQIAGEIKAARIASEGRLQAALMRVASGNTLDAKDLAEIEKLAAEGYEKYINTLGKDEKPVSEDTYRAKFMRRIGIDTSPEPAKGTLSKGKNGELVYNPAK